MTVEFLVSSSLPKDIDTKREIIKKLSTVLVQNQNEFDDRATNEMVRLSHRRLGEVTQNSGGAELQHTIIGFGVDLPDDTELPEKVIEDFIKEMSGADYPFHILRFEDPVLQAKLARYSDEIFLLEMKLRRILSIIFLHGYQTRDPYTLLGMVDVKIQGSPTDEDMRIATENEFFHLLFSDYIRVNNRNSLSLVELRRLIHGAHEYEQLHDEIERTFREVIDDQQDVLLIKQITRDLQPIEDMRNCVAHYRRPDHDITYKYEVARDQLDKTLDQYLSRWEW